MARTKTVLLVTKPGLVRNVTSVLTCYRQGGTTRV